MNNLLDVFRPNNLIAILSWILEVAMQSEFLLVLMAILLIIIMIAPYSFAKSKIGIRRSFINFYAFLFITIVAFYSLDIFMNLESSSNDISKNELFIAVTLAGLCFSGFFTIIAYIIFFINRKTAYDFNSKLLNSSKYGYYKEIMASHNEIVLTRKCLEVFDGLKGEILALDRSKEKRIKLSKHVEFFNLFPHASFQIHKEKNIYLLINKKKIPNPENLLIVFNLFIIDLKKNTTYKVISNDYLFDTISGRLSNGLAKELVEFENWNSLLEAKSISEELLDFIKYKLKEKTKLNQEIIKELNLLYERPYVSILSLHVNNILEMISMKHNYLVPINLAAKINHITMGLFKFYLFAYYIHTIVR